MILEPYNAILETHKCMNFEDACLVFDNEALYNICDKKLHIANPSYTNLNRLVAQVSLYLNVIIYQYLLYLLPTICIEA